jgi:flavodoxin
MRAVVVYESMFGNTQAIADAVANGLASSMRVDLLEVGEAPATIDDDVALLVAGGPTHAFGMSRPQTRADAAQQAEQPVVSAGIGLREWLAAAGRRTGDTVAATFDTRVDRPRVPGSAAHAGERRLRRLGFPAIAPAESFYVGGTSGPLVEGEVERARRWGEELGRTVVASGARHE